LFFPVWFIRSLKVTSSSSAAQVCESIAYGGILSIRHLVRLNSPSSFRLRRRMLVYKFWALQKRVYDIFTTVSLAEDNQKDSFHTVEDDRYRVQNRKFRNERQILSKFNRVRQYQRGSASVAVLFRQSEITYRYAGGNMHPLWRVICGHGFDLHFWVRRPVGGQLSEAASRPSDPTTATTQRFYDDSIISRRYIAYKIYYI